jgi:hypothetical protein
LECFFDILYIVISFVRGWLQSSRFAIILYCFLELYFFLYFEFFNIKIGTMLEDIFLSIVIQLFLYFYYACHYLIIFVVQLILFLFMYVILFFLLYTSFDKQKYEIYLSKVDLL